MATATLSPPSASYLPAKPALFRLSVQQYHEMIANHILTTEDKVELIDGYLVNKIPQNNPHSSTIQRLDKRLHRILPDGWEVRVQLPITLSHSVPEPDVAIVRGDDRSFDTHNPMPAHFGIIFEISDSTLAFDRGVKLELYAEAGLPEYWIVNLVDAQVEVYTQPISAASPTIYMSRMTYSPGQQVPVVMDGIVLGSLAVADLLP